MQSEAALDQIVVTLRSQAHNANAFELAQQHGLWLRPHLGGKTAELQGRVLVFDVTRPVGERLTSVGRCVARFVLAQRDRLASLGATLPAIERDEPLRAS